jgi:hypothetical protein
MSEINASNFKKEHGDLAPDLVGVTELTSPYFFVPPSGDTASRPEDCEPGTLRFNTDHGTLEIFRGKVIGWEQIQRRENQYLGGGTGSNTGTGTRAVHAIGGDYPSVSNSVEFYTIDTLGNTQDFGDLTQSRQGMGSGSSSTRGLFMGGGNFAAPIYNIIDFMTIPSLGNATDFGDLTRSDREVCGSSNQTRAISFGGYDDPAGAAGNEIDFMTISSTGNAVDFGNLLVAAYAHGKGICASPTRGIISGGQYSGTPAANTIQFITFSTTGNAVDFGDMSALHRDHGSGGNSTRGIFAGGSGASDTRTNVIDFITIATLGNSADFGDDAAGGGTSQCASASSPTRMVTSGGNLSSGTVNTMHFIEIATTGNSQDFGDLQTLGEVGNAVSSGHGGL